LGIIYFTVFISLIALSVGFMVNPLFVRFLNAPLITFGGQEYYLSHPALMPIVVVGGLILLLATMHLAKFVGRLHGVFAKNLLVGDRMEYKKSGKRNLSRDSNRMEDPMEINEKAKPKSEERPPLLAIVLAIAVFAAVIGLTLFAFLTSS